MTVNGEARELPVGTTIEELVAVIGPAREGRGVAVALAGEVVPRGAWGATALSEGASVEVVVAVQGG